MKRATIALLATLSLSLLIGAAPTKNTPRVITLPQSFTQTPEGAVALMNLQETLERVGSDYIKKLSDKEVADLLVRGLMSAVDPHSTYLTPQEAREASEQRQGSFGGIGIEITKSDDPALPGIMIVSPIDDTPGQRAGLQPKDLIIKVNEVTTVGLTLNEVVRLLRGPVGDAVTLTIYRKGTIEPFGVTIVRDTIRIQFAKSELKAEGVGYIKLTQFGAGVCKKMLDEFEKLTVQNGKPLAGLILDLRGNPGGLLDQAVCIPNQFLDAQRYTMDGQRVTLSDEARGVRQPIADVSFYQHGDILRDKPLLVIINGGSASASEIVAGVLMTHGRATIAGIEKSFGKGSIQSQFPLYDGSKLMLTTGQYMVGPVGCERAVQNVGVTPDIMLKRTDKDPKEILGTREQSLPHSLDTAQMKNENCKFNFVVPPEHKAVAYKMLALIGLEPVAPPTP